MDNTKSEMRLRNSSNQFMQLADRLLGAIKGEQNEVAAAMKEAKGFNIVSSKSTKVLPIAKQFEGKNRGNGKFISEQQSNLQQQQQQERLRVSESVKNILYREQARDEQLASRLKKINEKQAARIKQVESQELRN